MSRRTILVTIAAAALLGAAAVGIAQNRQWSTDKDDTGKNDNPSEAYPEERSDEWVDRRPSFTQPVRPIPTDVFIDPDDVDRIWADAVFTDHRPQTTDHRPIAGIVNHHTLAADLIADFFVRLKASRPDVKRFVIISPDHFNAGRGYVSTHERPYATGSDKVEIDEEAVRALTTSGLATEEDEELFEREHGIGALVPFLANAYPGAYVVPIAFRGDMPQEPVRALREALRGLWDDETVVILSADMSHYLTTEEALKHDEDTIVWLRTMDETIADATDDNIDSGKSAAAVFAVMRNLYHDASFTMFDHAISSDYGGDDTYTTSYITGIWSVN